ncbi:hypothetical protein QCA50_005196 [Cerrena zonata]|uniref:Transmembrane protein n=1 Tax=Cerrena zonata TaxID=2478898 RepID=A0AAW0GE80_9APHY
MSSARLGTGRRRRHEVTVSANGAPVSSLAEDDATRKAVLEVVQVWLDRLQLISVITTFFSSIDGLLLGFSANIAQLGVRDVREWNASTKLMVAALSGALIFHVCAAITSFTGSFILIRYKLLDADLHEHEVEGSGGSTTTHPVEPSTSTAATATATSPPNSPQPHSPSLSSPLSPNVPTYPTVQSIKSLHDKDRLHRTRSNPVPAHLARAHTSNSLQHLAQAASHSLDFLPLYWNEIFNDFQGRVFIDRIHPFAFLFPKNRRRSANNLNPEKGGTDGDGNSGGNTTNDGTNLNPPIKLLMRCHNLSAAMSTCGFILACLGILAFLWTSLPRDVAIFGSACLGVCLVSGMIVFNAT